jgi:hypothetical protein
MSLVRSAIGLGGRRLVEYSAKPNKNMPQTLADLEKLANTLWRIYSALVEVVRFGGISFRAPLLARWTRCLRHLGASKLDWRNTKRRLYRSEGLPGSSRKHTIKDTNMRQRMEATGPTNVAKPDDHHQRRSDGTGGRGRAGSATRVERPDPNHARPIENRARGRGTARIYLDVAPNRVQKPFDGLCAMLTLPTKIKRPASRKGRSGKRRRANARAR